ncbi:MULTISPECIES: cytochrome c biogenesis protein ResB [unclassified Streptomyces]|uniref:cytochrome c biogenesis protein ResB n=1 Tax=unclassified Streptomyces TaxID=2593676 RepID=UPI00278C648D|nr:MULTISPECIES: cytochrome c biogenesis protein ResB [unclassified Streptomyces]
MSKTTDDARTAGGDEAAEAEAAAQLSTAPQEDRAPNLPKLGVIGWVRWFWRQLTSMRVALILLFLLSLGAIPGSLIPQEGTDPTKVEDFRKAHETLAPVYDKIGFFHVYGSVWFSAIYLLLFVSLIGCIVPRTWQFVGQLRGRPPGAPKRLTRLPAYATWRTESDPEQVRTAALAMLKKRRYRAHVSGTAVAAEKGYLREVGNLVFHIALIVMLVAFAWGQLFKFEGGKLVIEGDGFANTLTQYDDFKSGNLFDSDHDLSPFSFTLDKFTATYERSGPEKGTPRTFRGDVSYTEGSGDKTKKAAIESNKPLDIDGTKIFLNGHGYAVPVTVRDGKGKVVSEQTVPMLPIDSNISSQGAIKVMDGYKNAQGKKEQLGFAAWFVPTFAGAGKGTMLSQFPALDYPVLALNASHGDLGVDAGLPQNVYQLDTSHLKSFKDSKGKALKQRLLPGETMKLPNGAGSITFDKDIKEWVTFQISHQPGDTWALGGAIAAIGGLAGSLFIQRRRVWVRAVKGEDGVTVVEMAGLGRSESAKLPEELGDLVERLHTQAPSAPDPDEPSESTTAVPAAEGAETK